MIVKILEDMWLDFECVNAVIPENEETICVYYHNREMYVLSGPYKASFLEKFEPWVKNRNELLTKMEQS